MRQIGLVVAMLTLTGCLSVYRMDVQQGNVLTADRLEQLKPGLSRSQVRFVLGTPLVTDPFHPDRWDYVYSFRRGGSDETEVRRLTLYFQNDALSRIVGDLASAVAPIETPAAPGTGTRY